MKWLERFWFGCGHCHGGSCPLADAASESEASPAGRGAPLAASCLAVFVLPLALAICGAWALGRCAAEFALMPQAAGQALGAVTGLAAGIALAKLMTQWILRRERAVDGGVG